MGIKENFEAKFEKTTGCWLWQAAKTSQGYGQFGYKGMMRGAHRVAFELYVAEIPAGMHVLHTCDTPGCVNPAHLKLGSNADNVADRSARGRTAKFIGEAHHNAAFSQEQVEAIKKEYASRKISHRSLAFKYGVSKTTIGYLLRGRTYE